MSNITLTLSAWGPHGQTPTTQARRSPGALTRFLQVHGGATDRRTRPRTASSHAFLADRAADGFAGRPRRVSFSRLNAILHAAACAGDSSKSVAQAPVANAIGAMIAVLEGPGGGPLPLKDRLEVFHMLGQEPQHSERDRVRTLVSVL